MYKSSYDREARDEVNFFKKNILWFVLLLATISVGTYLLTRGTQVIETGIISYEQFQEMYNTCQKLNTDLGVVNYPSPKGKGLLWSVSDIGAQFTRLSQWKH